MALSSISNVPGRRVYNPLLFPLRVRLPLSPVLLRGQPVGRLNVPRLRLSSVIVEGVEADSLDLGVGHMSDSAPLGGIGNIVLAGHRDTALWPLRNLHQGDRVELISSRRSVYTVRSLTIVDPSDVALLRPTAESLLTIVTCYPFRHVGPAPKRLIIQATPSQKGASPLPVPHPTE